MRTAVKKPIMARSSVLFVCLLLAPSLVCGSFFYTSLQKQKLKLLPEIPPDQLPPDTWFQQRLDHFDPHDSRVWLQRYFVNDTFWDPQSGPVFLNIEGEGAAFPGWVVEGEMMTNAQKHKALAVSLEHRFYGKSHPTPDLSTANLRYLSSHQALADIAGFHDYIVEQYKLTDDNKWIAFGGSYSGALAAWLRIKYPHIVIGSVASSAPVQAELNFSQYFEVVGQSLAQSMEGEPCVDAIKTAMTTVTAMASDRASWPKLDQIFNIDPPLSSPEDVNMLAFELVMPIASLVQYNNDSGKVSYNMNSICAVMVNTATGDPINRLAKIVEFVNGSFISIFEALSDTKWDDRNTLAAGARQWFYQTCTELGYFQTTDSKNQPFGSLIPLDMFTRVCQVLFDIDASTVAENIEQTNSMYGGKEISKSITNIVFPNGSIDPWHALGVTTNISDSLVAIFINGTAHCANMYPESPNDPPQLVKAREQISAIIQVWLT